MHRASAARARTQTCWPWNRAVTSLQRPACCGEMRWRPCLLQQAHSAAVSQRWQTTSYIHTCCDDGLWRPGSEGTELGSSCVLHAGGSCALLMCTVNDSTAASAPKRALTMRNIAHARTAVTVGPSQGSRFWLRTCVPLVVIFEALRNYIPAEPSILTLGYLRDVLDLGHHKH